MHDMDSDISLDAYSALGLPEFNLIEVAPIKIYLDSGHKYWLLFKIPSVDKYFKFESAFATLAAKHLEALSGVKFMTYEEISDNKIVQQVVESLHPAMQNAIFVKDFSKLLRRYFKSNFNIRKLATMINPLSLQYLFMLTYSAILEVKKKLVSMITKGEISIRSLISSTSLSTTLERIEPRY